MKQWLRSQKVALIHIQLESTNKINVSTTLLCTYATFEK